MSEILSFTFSSLPLRARFSNRKYIHQLIIDDRRYLVGTTTVWSGASYIYTKDAVKILNAGSRGQGSGKA